MKIRKKPVVFLLLPLLLILVIPLSSQTIFASLLNKGVVSRRQNFIIGESEIVENIIILDKSKIDVYNSKCFTIGDIDGDKINELISFKSFVGDSKTECKINIYHKTGESWYLINSLTLRNILGYVSSVEIGNFDSDSAQEIVLGSIINGGQMFLYILDFNPVQKNFKSNLIFKSYVYLNDLCVYKAINSNVEGILALCSFNIGSSENFGTQVLKLNPKSDGEFESKVIYSEQAVYWNLISSGVYYPLDSREEQIILHRYQVKDAGEDQSIIKVIDPQGKIISTTLYLDEHKKVRDIVAWDADKDGFDELGILESNYDVEQMSYENEMMYYKVNGQNVLDSKKVLLNTRQWLTQMTTGDLDGTGNKLVILDPPAGVMPYLRVFDEEARLVYNLFGYGSVNLEFDVFELFYEVLLDIDAYRVGDYLDYYSNGYYPSALLLDLYTDVDEDIRDFYKVDVVIGVLWDIHSELIKGIAKPSWHTAIIFGSWLSPVSWRTINHEVGHLFGIPVATDHCPNALCLMHGFHYSWIIDFCSTCKAQLANSLDEKYGKPIFPTSYAGLGPLAGSYVSGTLSDLENIGYDEFVWETTYWPMGPGLYGFSIHFWFPPFNEQLPLTYLEIYLEFGGDCRVYIEWEGGGTSEVYTSDGVLRYNCNSKKINWLSISYVSYGVPCDTYVYLDTVRAYWEFI